MSGFKYIPKSVGYGRPPKHSQFKEGTSGNPAGRPKGSKNKMQFGIGTLEKDIIMQADRMVDIKGQEGTERIPMREAIIRAILVSAAQGKLGAQKLGILMIEKAEERNRKRIEENVDFVNRLKSENKQKVKSLLAMGDVKRAESILPLEEHIGLDLYTYDVKFTGPIDENEKDLWDKTWASKRVAEAKVPKLISKLKQRPSDMSLLNVIGAVNQQIREANIILHKRWHRSLEELIPCQFERTEFEEMLAEVSKKYNIP